MKKLWIALLCLCLLAGCGVKQTFETVDDLYVVPASATMNQVSMALPQEAALSVMENEQGDKLYLCDGYSVTVQTRPSGDLDKTLRETTGFPEGNLKLISTERNGIDRYDCVWTAVGEEGEQVCRTAILDDGSYHYVVTAMAPEKNAGSLTETWNSLLNSLTLVSTD